jgi:hypothetical protein
MEEDIDLINSARTVKMAINSGVKTVENSSARERTWFIAVHVSSRVHFDALICQRKNAFVCFPLTAHT